MSATDLSLATGDVKPREDPIAVLRLSLRAADVITDVAGVLGVSLSEFTIARATAEASAVVDDHLWVRPNPESFDRFVAALDGPAVAIAPTGGSDS
ncbi:MAG: DUF1778 domain-containing protein [Acidimicrobiales bacterium]